MAEDRIEMKKKRVMELNPGLNPKYLDLYEEKQFDEMIKAGEARQQPQKAEPEPEVKKQTFKEALMEGFDTMEERADKKEKRKSEELVRRLRLRQGE